MARSRVGRHRGEPRGRGPGPNGFSRLCALPGRARRSAARAPARAPWREAHVMEWGLRCILSKVFDPVVLLGYMYQLARVSEEHGGVKARPRGCVPVARGAAAHVAARFPIPTICFSARKWRKISNMATRMRRPRSLCCRGTSCAPQRYAALLAAAARATCIALPAVGESPSGGPPGGLRQRRGQEGRQRPPRPGARPRVGAPQARARVTAREAAKPRVPVSPVRQRSRSPRRDTFNKKANGKAGKGGAPKDAGSSWHKPERKESWRW